MRLAIASPRPVPSDFVEKYGVDAVRYFLMREMVLGADANFTEESFIKRYNSDLANDFGNLLNRVSGFITKNFDGNVPEASKTTSDDDMIQGIVVNLRNRVNQKIQEFKIHEAIDDIIGYVGMANKYLEQQAPWKVAKEDRQRAGTILYNSCEALRICAVFLKPVMPLKAQAVLTILSANDSGLTWGELKPGTKLQAHDALFPRIELEKK